MCIYTDVEVLECLWMHGKTGKSNGCPPSLSVLFLCHRVFRWHWSLQFVLCQWVAGTFLCLPHLPSPVQACSHTWLFTQVLGSELTSSHLYNKRSCSLIHFPSLSFYFWSFPDCLFEYGLALRSSLATKTAFSSILNLFSLVSSSVVFGLWALCAFSECSHLWS